MALQKEFERVQTHLDNISGSVNVFFEAHYWGRFRLLTNTGEVFPDAQGLIPLAQSQSPPYDTWLLIDPVLEHIYLREGDALEGKLIASALREFLGKEQAFVQHLQNHTAPYIFDLRQPLSALLPANQYTITDIDDPEFFEDLEGYYKLLSIIAELTNGDLSFDEIRGSENGMRKKIILTKGDQTWTIDLERELFDNAIIHQLNKILVHLNISDYRLSTSVNEAMKMVVLKLEKTSFARLEKMGLLI